MYKSLLILLSPLMLAACNNNHSADNVPPNDNSPADTSGTYPPVETGTANTNYKPAFEGQTRVAGVKTKTPYDVKVLSEGLKSPWGITQLPDGRLLITQKAAGTMVIATADGKLSEPITGLPAVNPDGQGGLLDVAIDPNFSSNKMLYWTFSEKTADGNLTAVAKGTLSADEKRVENVTVIYRATPGIQRHASLWRKSHFR